MADGDVRGWAQRRQGAAERDVAHAKDRPDVVAKIRRLARKAGATLAHGGKGGLDPRLALRVFERDEWTCSIPNCETAKEKLDLDHIGGHPLEIEDDPDATEFLRKAAEKGKTDDLKGLHVLCLRHHDMVHDRERALEDGDEPDELTE